MARRAEPPAPGRQVAFRLGLSAESRAAAYLIAKGHRIVARRWRSPVGEIDIVARRRNTLLFVEVKARARPASRSSPASRRPWCSTKAGRGLPQR